MPLWKKKSYCVFEDRSHMVFFRSLASCEDVFETRREEFGRQQKGLQSNLELYSFVHREDLTECYP
jgi:hypothetical protein